MAAYAALLSLARSLHQISNLEHDSINPLHQQKIVSLGENVDFIVTFLENSSEKHRGTLADHVGREIRNASYEAQDFVDSYLGSMSRTSEDWSSSEADLNMAFERIEFIKEEVMKIKNNETAAEIRRTSPFSFPVRHSFSAVNKVVGFDHDLYAIKERLYDDSDRLEIISIVGMGGIGKTTLARKAYDDSLLAQHFDICAWVTLSLEYQRRQALLGLLQYLKIPDNDLSHQSDAQLATLVYRSFIGRRYLVVVDDIWSTNAWDDLKMIFPDDDSRSRILLTTRLSDVAVHVGSSGTSLHQMNLLKEDQSWKLLQEKIFGQESCPPHLLDIGKKIARSCAGLPLTIVVVAGLLISSDDMTNGELWENISENINSTEPTIALQCSKILCLSYDWLPLRLKPCFLYMSAFPEDFEIEVSRLIMLWVAEGFIKQSEQSMCLEDTGELYLVDLVNRSLILESRKGLDGKLKTIRIHDLLREICVTKAEEEGFLHDVSSKTNAKIKVIEIPYRRISIHSTDDFETWQIGGSNIHSVLFLRHQYLESTLSPKCRHLTILEAPDVTYRMFSYIISTFVNLRYIAFALNFTSCPDGFPTSIFELPNLQTIIARINSFALDITLQVPCELWGMPKLRHFIIDNSFGLSYPSDMGFILVSDLQILETAMDLRFTEKFVKVFVNIKKLKVCYSRSFDDLDEFYLNNLFHLQNLEELKFSMYGNHYTSISWNFAFPINLKKLILEGVPFPWEKMAIIGSLPNLQGLNMMDISRVSDEVSEWMPIEGQFLQLKCFCSSLDFLEKWEMEKEHFPRLESLLLHKALYIDELPCGIGEMDSLQLIMLNRCAKSLVNSAKRIQEQQHDNGNDAFQLRLIDCDE